MLRGARCLSQDTNGFREQAMLAGRASLCAVSIERRRHKAREAPSPCPVANSCSRYPRSPLRDSSRKDAKAPSLGGRRSAEWGWSRIHHRDLGRRARVTSVRAAIGTRPGIPAWTSDTSIGGSMPPARCSIACGLASDGSPRAWCRPGDRGLGGRSGVVPLRQRGALQYGEGSQTLHHGRGHP